MKKKTLLWIAIPSVLVVLIARDCYRSSKPSKLGTVSIPELRMTISLFCKSRPRAGIIAPYEGEYRILEVIQRGQPMRYYDLPDTLPAEQCHLEVFWYPTNHLVRFEDLLLGFGAQGRSETVLDLEKHILYSLVRYHDRTYRAKLSLPLPSLCFPKADEKSRANTPWGFATSTSSDNPNPVDTVFFGNDILEATEESWAKDTGNLVGVIAPKRKQ